MTQIFETHCIFKWSLNATRSNKIKCMISQKTNKQKKPKYYFSSCYEVLRSNLWSFFFSKIIWFSNSIQSLTWTLHVVAVICCHRFSLHRCWCTYKIISERFECTQHMTANKSCLGRAAKVLSPPEPNCFSIILLQAFS